MGDGPIFLNLCGAIFKKAFLMNQISSRSISLDKTVIPHLLSTVGYGTVTPFVTYGTMEKYRLVASGNLFFFLIQKKKFFF
jgi:hypothetical protein